MKRRVLMTSLFLAMAAFFGHFAIADADSVSLNEARQRALNEKVVHLLHEIHRLKADGNPVETTGRSADGDVVQPGKDCDPQPTCVPNCVNRFSDGSCASYGKDYCGPEAKCAMDCTVRFTDGSCGNYGPDFCGRNAECLLNCTVRYSDGTCGDYGPDVCY